MLINHIDESSHRVNKTSSYYLVPPILITSIFFFWGFVYHISTRF